MSRKIIALCHAVKDEPVTGGARKVKRVIHGGAKLALPPCRDLLYIGVRVSVE